MSNALGGTRAPGTLRFPDGSGAAAAAGSMRGSATAAPDRIGIFALLVLIVLHVAVHIDALLVIDSGRDVANAWLIAKGANFPLWGPSIYGTWSLGPVWFYLLAIPLWFDSQSLTPLALLIGVLGAAKLPLAYFLGRRLYGPSAGIVQGDGQGRQGRRDHGGRGLRPGQ